MIPRNQKNRKTRVNLACPTCGMSLSAKATIGFTRDGETFCCQGCAEGTGCTCATPAHTTRNPRRRLGAIEQRGPGAGLTNGSLDQSSFSQLVEGRKSAAAAARYPSRKAGARIDPKRKRSVTKERDSTRQQAQGRSEFTGDPRGPARISKTRTKTRKPN